MKPYHFLPLTSILYHRLWEKSIGNVAQSFNQIIVQNDEAPIKRRALAVGATARKKEDKKETCSVFAVATIRQSIYLIPYIPLAVGVKTKQKAAIRKGLDICTFVGGCTLHTKRSRLCPLWLGLLVRVLQGLPSSPQSSLIRMPTATPHLLVRVRGGLTIGYLGEVAKPT